MSWRLWGVARDAVTNSPVAWPKIAYTNEAGTSTYYTGDGTGAYDLMIPGEVTPVTMNALGYDPLSGIGLDFYSGVYLNKTGSAPGGVPGDAPAKDNTILYIGLAVAGVIVAKKMNWF